MSLFAIVFLGLVVTLFTGFSLLLIFMFCWCGGGATAASPPVAAQDDAPSAQAGSAFARAA